MDLSESLNLETLYSLDNWNRKSNLGPRKFVPVQPTAKAEPKVAETEFTEAVSVAEQSPSANEKVSVIIGEGANVGSFESLD